MPEVKELPLSRVWNRRCLCCNERPLHAQSDKEFCSGCEEAKGLDACLTIVESREGTEREMFTNRGTPELVVWPPEDSK